MTIYDGLCQWNKETEIVIKCRKLSSTPLCAQCHDALKPPTNHSCAHAAQCDSPEEFGKLGGVSPKSAWPIRGARSACACQAARSSVHEVGPHSSELAVRFAKEKGMPCRTRICNLWLIMRLKMAWAPGAVQPNCSKTTGVIPPSKACRLKPSRWPYARHLVISSRRSSLATARSCRVDCVYLYIQPELGTLRFYDVNVSPVDGTHAARGRPPILL